MRRFNLRFDRPAIEYRLALVRAAKLAKARRGEPPLLTPRELDAVLAPGVGRRTRDRPEGGEVAS